MKKKVIFFSDPVFILECGHTAHFWVTREVNQKRAIQRFWQGKLYRDCPICQRRIKKDGAK